MVRPISDKTVWRILNSAVLAAFLLMGALNVADIVTERITSLTTLIVFEGVLLFLTFAGLLLSYVIEYKFLVYAVLCFFWGIDGLIAGKGLIGFIVYAVSFLFLWRQHNVSHKALLTVFLASLPFVLTIMLFAYDGEILQKTLMQFIAFALISALSFFLVQPVIARKKVTVSETIDVSGLGFSDREIRILEAALKAEKYTTIAARERISESYVKKCMKGICQKMQVADRTELLATYGRYSIRDADTEQGKRVARILP